MYDLTDDLPPLEKLERVARLFLDTMDDVARYRECLMRENPDGVAMHDALNEKGLLDIGMRNLVVVVERALERGGLPEDVMRTLRALHAEFEKHAVFMQGGAAIQ